MIIVYQHGILRKHRSTRKQVICATIVIDYLLLKPFELASINVINAWNGCICKDSQAAEGSHCELIGWYLNQRLYMCVCVC